MRAWKTWVTAAVLVWSCGLCGCKAPEIQSGWTEQPIRIDGNLDEWSSNANSFEEERITIAVRNDDRFLYVGVRSANPDILRRAVGGGLTVWIDPRGGKDQVLGIRYPKGFGPDRGREPGSDAGPGEPGPRTRRPGDFSRMLDAGEGPVLLRVLNGKRMSPSLTVDRAGGIDVALRGEGDELTYELRVPLTEMAGGTEAVYGTEAPAASEQPGQGAPGSAADSLPPARIRFAVGAAPGATIGLGFQIGGAGMSRRSMRREGPPEGMEGPEGPEGPGDDFRLADGRRQHGGGRGPGGPGGGYPRGGPGMMRPSGGKTMLWARVKLAQRP